MYLINQENPTTSFNGTSLKSFSWSFGLNWVWWYKRENLKEKNQIKKKVCVHVFISFEMEILSTHGAVFFRIRKCWGDKH